MHPQVGPMPRRGGRAEEEEEDGAASVVRRRLHLRHLRRLNAHSVLRMPRNLWNNSETESKTA